MAKWKWETLPCPLCGQQELIYDGSVKWRSGPRPPREMARKDGLGFSPRADFERDHFFHCAACQTLFYDPIDSYQPNLWAEDSHRKWRYSSNEGWIER